MGNSQSIYIYAVTDPRSINQQHLQHVSNLDNRKIWRNMKSGQQYQELKMKVKDLKQFEIDLVKYQRRRQQNIGIPVIHYVQKIGGYAEQKEANIQFKVFMEFLQKRLRQIQNISLSSSLFLMQKAFNVYSALFQQVGFFDINQDLIGIDNEGQPKFWFNSFWAANQPQSVSQTSKNTTHLQCIMVTKIFDVIQRHMDHLSIQNYIIEKNKIKQWTFELAIAFIRYFIKSQEINLPNKIIQAFSTPSISDSIVNNQRSRRQFSLKNPRYSIMMNYSETIINPEQKRKNNVSVGNLTIFDKKVNDIRKQDHFNEKFSVTGLNFRQSYCPGYKPPQPSPKTLNQTTKSCFGLIKLVSQPQLKLKQKLKQMKQSKHQFDSSFNTRKKQSSINISFTKSSQIQTQRKSKISSQTQTQSAVNSFIHQFRGGAKQKQNKLSFLKKISLNEQSNNKNVRQREDTHYSSTIGSSQYHSPVGKSKIIIKDSLSAEVKTGMVFSQQIYHPNNLTHQIKKQQTTSLLISRNIPTKQSNIEITQFKGGISEYCLQSNQENNKLKILAQSIVLDEMATEINKNDKILCMLDKLVMKEVLQINEGQIYTNNTKILAESYIEQ